MLARVEGRRVEEPAPSAGGCHETLIAILQWNKMKQRQSNEPRSGFDVSPGRSREGTLRVVSVDRENGRPFDKLRAGSSTRCKSGRSLRCHSVKRSFSCARPPAKLQLSGSNAGPSYNLTYCNLTYCNLTNTGWSRVRSIGLSPRHGVVRSGYRFILRRTKSPVRRVPSLGERNWTAWA